MKAEIVVRVLKEEETMSQIASEYGIHPNQITSWKSKFLQDAPSLFGKDHKPINALKAGYEKKIDELYTEIGRLSTQLNWLKKKSGRRVE